MLSFLKNLFGGAKPAPQAPAPPAAPSKAEPQARPAPAAPAAAAPAKTAPPSTPAPAASAPAAPKAGPQEKLSLPLKNIISQFPEDLKPVIVNPPGNDVTVDVPLKAVLEGLPRGAVKITYGELRQAAPAGVFSDATSVDQTVVQLPLKDILARIKPEHLTPRVQQKTIEIPDDVKPIFGPTGKTAAASTPTPAPAAQPPPPTPPSAPKAPAPAAQAPAPAPKAPSAPPAPAAPIKPMAPLPPPPTPAPTPAARPAAVPTPPAPTPAPAAAAGKLEGDRLSLPFAAVLPGVPEALRGELASLGQATLALKVSELEPMMKKGRVSFPWKQMRALINPAPPATLGAAHDETAVDVPLKLVIPHFMAGRKPAPAQKQVTVDQSIPDVFAGKLAAPAAPPAPAPAAPVSAPAAPPPPAAPAAPTAAPSKLGQIFGQPSKAAWTPVEIVQATVKLSGVAGALIATPDGLGVASQLPPGLNGDAMSGFLPEIFNRINQYTTDLKLGETSSVTVQVGKQPLEIRRTGKLYFAALGQPGQSLPSEKLSAIAIELEQ